MHSSKVANLRYTFRLQISVTLFGYECTLHFLGAEMETMLHALQFPAKILEKCSHDEQRRIQDRYGAENRALHELVTIKYK